MNEFDLKRGLFGYTKSSVYTYIADMSSDLKRKLTEANAENKSLQERYASLEKEMQMLSEKHQTELDALKEELRSKDYDLKDSRIKNDEYKKNHADIADVIMDARRFANELKEQAQNDYAQKTAENEERISKEKARIENRIKEINMLCENIRSICTGFAAEMEREKELLSAAKEKLDIDETGEKSTSPVKKILRLS